MEDKTAEVEMLRKQVKDVGAKEAEGKKKLESTLKDKESELEKVRIQLGSLEKEGRAIDVIQDELKTRTKERDELWAQVTKLNSEVEAKAYDLTKMKEERDAMMNTYEQRLKKTTEELSMEKREAVKMREVMLKSTPESSGSKLARSRGERLDRENTMLREELQKKTDVIKKLESMIPAKKELRFVYRQAERLSNVDQLAIITLT